MLLLISLLFGICLIALTNMTSYVDFFVSVAIAIFSLTYIFYLAKNEKIRFYSFPLIGGYLLRVALLYYDVYSNNFLNLPLVGGELTSDPLRFFNNAVWYSMGYSISYGGAFSKLMGIIFYFTTPSRLWGEFVVLLFSIMTVHVLIEMLFEIKVSDTARKRSIYFVCFFPNFLLLSVIFRRETIIAFFLALSLFFFIKWFIGRMGEKGFILSVLCALLSSLFHGATGLIIIGYLIIHLLYNSKSMLFQLEIKNILSCILSVSVFFLIFHTYGSVFFNKIEQRMESDSGFSINRDAGGSSYAKYVGDNSTPYNALIYMVPRFAYYMFSPFPWQWRGFSDVISFILSSCIYFIILYKTFVCIRKSTGNVLQRNLLIALFLIALFIGSLFSWGVSNTGTAIRHRDKVIAMYAVMYCLAWDANRGKRTLMTVNRNKT